MSDAEQLPQARFDGFSSVTDNLREESTKLLPAAFAGRRRSLRSQPRRSTSERRVQRQDYRSRGATLCLEQATGVDVIIDDTPELITLARLNPVRRELRAWRLSG